jgi:hypothetical protein
MAETYGSLDPRLAAQKDKKPAEDGSYASVIATLSPETQRSLSAQRPTPSPTPTPTPTAPPREGYGEVPANINEAQMYREKTGMTGGRGNRFGETIKRLFGRQ